MEFRCKTFSLFHSKSSMKVGTDAILICALSPKLSFNNILDIGTGCGIISLCMAQRNEKSQILAIDIDRDSVDEANENFESSIYRDRIKAIELDFIEYHRIDKKFDLIISNPPFFINSLQCPDSKRNRARHTASLSFEKLIEGVAAVIEQDGIFCVILPYKESLVLSEIAINNGFSIIYKAEIFSKQDKPCQRVVLHLSKTNSCYCQQRVVLRNSDNTYSSQYNLLTQDFLI